MNDTIPPPTERKATNAERERTKQIIIASCTACIVAFMAFWALVFQPVWPMAIGVVAVAAMAATTYYILLKKAS
jgi:CHASE2 domain-containing sensor protein